MNLLNELAAHLVANGFGTTLGVDVFVDYEPEQPYKLISIREYGGNGLPNIGTAVRNIQINVRDPNAENGKQTAFGIYSLLAPGIVQDNKGGILDLTDNRWLVVTSIQAPFKNGFAANKYSRFTFNMGVHTTIERS